MNIYVLFCVDRFNWVPPFCRVLVMLIAGLVASPVQAERISDVVNTKHNLSVSGPGDVTAQSETQVCVFCHTPHGADISVAAPLWNRSLSSTSYTPYSSSSLDATGLGQPGGSSKLCLSCHDGTIAIGNVNALNGLPSGQDISMFGTTNDKMPVGTYGSSSGFTRNLGSNLTNDHPISFDYDTDLSNSDGELFDPELVTWINNRTVGVSPPLIPLEDGKLQCSSCHDPHIRDLSGESIKFLRHNRFQTAAPSSGSYNETTDILCLGCHNKSGWSSSAHAISSVANETYLPGATDLRDFPADIPVWKAACLNCHDTHTVEGSRRLLREGTDSLLSPKTGGNSAIEETCYQCHTSSGNSILSSVNNLVPDIETDFALLRSMPIDITNEAHDIGTVVASKSGADFLETPAKLGRTTPSNRHVECTDCHNPHRVIKTRLFNGNGNIPDAVGTHTHSSGHTNLASGVLSGAWGVEPIYSSTSSVTFGEEPVNFTVKKGYPTSGASTDVTNIYVTREYQVCLKCHSNYGYPDAITQDGNPNNTGAPALGAATPNYPSPTGSGPSNYTNQAMEFVAPSEDVGEITVNHRSWHPAMAATGRTYSVRGSMNQSSMFLSPWNGSADMGNQTMYCSDCHGSSTASGTVEPSGGDDGNSWGPHGSSKPFILKGDYDAGTGQGSSNDLCFMCHSYNNYATENSTKSGFCCDRDNNLHGLHAKRIDTGIKCNYCHVALPHGWKNKALLVNLNDVGPEGGQSPGTSVATNFYSYAPYYRNASLRIVNWRKSGTWRENDCGKPGNTGKDWMKDTCQDAP